MKARTDETITLAIRSGSNLNNTMKNEPQKGKHLIKNQLPCNDGVKEITQTSML